MRTSSVLISMRLSVSEESVLNTNAFDVTKASKGFGFDGNK